MSPPQAVAVTAPPKLRHIVRSNISQRHRAEILGSLVVLSVLNAAIEMHLDYAWLGCLSCLLILVRDSALLLCIAEEEGLV